VPPPGARLSQADLSFLVAAAAPEVRDKARLRRLLAEDDDFREAFLDDEKTWHRVAAEQEVFLRISPRLYFEVLLRRARRELDSLGHTIERTGGQKVAVFDAGEVVDLLSRRAVLAYLAEMLSSFTRIESYTLAFRVRPGVWRKIRFNDLDLDSLIRFAEAVEEDQRLGLFKRIADLCLFVLGLFPEYVRAKHRYPVSGQLRPQLLGRARRGPEEYEAEGRRFYGLAAEHPAAAKFGLSEVFSLLGGRFRAAQKPLSFIAERYLHAQRRDLFGLGRAGLP